MNDGFGHETGDIVLKTFAAALQANCPAGSVVARLGGDEFCVVEKGVPKCWRANGSQLAREHLPTRLELACPTPLACQVSHGSAHLPELPMSSHRRCTTPIARFYRSKSARLPLDWGVLARSREPALAALPQPADDRQPRPTNGILVAMMVMNCTLASSGRLAICTMALATCLHVHARLHHHLAIGLQHAFGHPLGHFGGGVADVDLTAGDVVLADRRARWFWSGR